MIRLPYTNLHSLNLDWIIEKLKSAFTPDNPPNATEIPRSDTNAETVAQALNRILTMNAFSGDCDTISETCIVYATDEATNSPGNWYIIFTLVYNFENAAAQLAIGVRDGEMCFRTKSVDGWTDWKTVEYSEG